MRLALGLFIALVELAAVAEPGIAIWIITSSGPFYAVAVETTPPGRARSRTITDWEYAARTRRVAYAPSSVVFVKAKHRP